MPKKGGLSALMKPSKELSAVIGGNPLTRGQVMKGVWKYIKKHDLQDTKNRREIEPDTKLAGVFGTKKNVNMFKMVKLLQKHLKAA